MTISPSLRKGTNIEERVPNMIESLFSLAESHASAFDFSDVDAVEALVRAKGPFDLVVACDTFYSTALAKATASAIARSRATARLAAYSSRSTRRAGWSRRRAKRPAAERRGSACSEQPHGDHQEDDGGGELSSLPEGFVEEVREGMREIREMLRKMQSASAASEA